MVAGAVSAHNMSKAQQQQAMAQQQQAEAQHAQAQQLARAASAAEQQALLAAQVADHQRQLAEQVAEQSRRAQFAQWRQTPDGRAYEDWKLQATELASDVLARVRPAANFQPKVVAAHAHDVRQALQAHPDPSVQVPHPREQVIATPESKPVFIGAAVVGFFVVLPLSSNLFNQLLAAVAPQSSGLGGLGTIAALVATGALCFFGAKWIQRGRLAKADRDRESAATQYEAAVGRWRDWQAAQSAARAGRLAYLAGASEDPAEVPKWWEVSAIDGGFIAMPEEIEKYEARAMREFPSPSSLPRLQRPSFRVLDSVPAGPEVQKALAWYRSQNPTTN